MAKIGMFWGSTTDMTKEASELIHEGLEAAGHEIDSYDIRNTDPSKMLEYDNLLIGCPTWNGGKLIGKWSTEGYEFDESLGCVDGEFLGLAIDYDNQDDLTEERIEAWVEQIKDLFE